MTRRVVGRVAAVVGRVPRPAAASARGGRR
jgi:hypothetical protein